MCGVHNYYSARKQREVGSFESLKNMLNSSFWISFFLLEHKKLMQTQKLIVDCCEVNTDILGCMS